MPNWCMNRLTISADPSMIQQIQQVIAARESDKKGPGLLQFFHPRPADQDENWYEWNINNWGTKWDIDVDIIDVGDESDYIELVFDSAWGPPCGALQHWQSQTPGTSLRLDYLESGCEFGGYLDISASGFVDDVTYYDDEYREYARDTWGIEEDEEEEEPFTEWYLDGVQQLKEDRHD